MHCLLCTSLSLYKSQHFLVTRSQIKSSIEKTMKVVFLVLLVLLAAKHSYPLPLSTKSRWVVNDLTGERVKFKCVNWPAHLEPMLAEGLDKRPLSLIAKHVGLLRFNCVRLTYATHMFTRYSNKTVVQSFRDLKLTNAINGLQKNNPQVLNLTLVDALSKVIDVIASYGIMVVLDNHISKPMWCCSNDDGNGFFGDRDFDPREWLNGWSIVGERYRNTPMVVAMSLRNELRGRRQNVNEWYRWVRQGATTIHKANPNVLVIISGLNYDLDFSYLKSKPLGLENVLPNKIVYETHRYSFSDGQAKWLRRPLNQICDSVIHDINKRVGFVTSGPHPAPLFVSEFGVNLMGTNRADNYFLTCYMAYLAESDLDWALWALQGSYYLRQGVQNMDEPYGLLDTNWTRLRNPDFNRKLNLIHLTLQVPKLTSSNYTFMYHPLTGRCVEYDNKNQIFADECDKLTRLSHGVDDWNPIQLETTPLCIMIGGEGLPVKLTTDCYAEQTTWRSISRFQIATKDFNGTDLCLDYDPNSSSKILSKKCICNGNDASKCLNNPQSQWFEFVSTNTRLF